MAILNVTMFVPLNLVAIFRDWLTKHRLLRDLDTMNIQSVKVFRVIDTPAPDAIFCVQFFFRDQGRMTTFKSSEYPPFREGILNEFDGKILLNETSMEELT